MHFKQLSVLALAGHALAQDTPSLLQALNSTSQLSQLSQVLALVPNLVQSLSGAQNVTLLAPSNEALGRIPNATLQSLTQNTGQLAALLEYHVLNGTYRAADITNSTTFVPTLLNNQLFANVTGGQRVAVTRANGNVTFFSGLGDNSTVTTANVNFTGGVIHIINRVLTLPESPSDTALAAGLTSLAGALTNTSLVNTVNNLRDVTIFAPNNAAFQAISSGLGSLSTADLANILTYHVVNGTVGYSPTLQNNTQLRTASGGNVTVTVRNGTVFVNNARVVTPNVLVDNGVVHVIDAVLNPSNATIAGPNANSGAPAFSGASSGTAAPFTSGLPQPSRSIAPQPTTTAASGSPAAGGNSGAAAKQTAAAAILGLGAAMVHFL